MADPSALTPFFCNKHFQRAFHALALSHLDTWRGSA
jgi:hypothetical protein